MQPLRDAPRACSAGSRFTQRAIVNAAAGKSMGGRHWPAARGRGGIGSGRGQDEHAHRVCGGMTAHAGCAESSLRARQTAARKRQQLLARHSVMSSSRRRPGSSKGNRAQHTTSAFTCCVSVPDWMTGAVTSSAPGEWLQVAVGRVPRCARRLVHRCQALRFAAQLLRSRARRGVGGQESRWP